MNTDDAQGAREAAFDAREYVLLARSGNVSIAEGLPPVNEVAAWCVILERVFRWLKNDDQVKTFFKQIETLPEGAVENAGPKGNGSNPPAGSVPRLQRSAGLAAGPSARISPSETGCLDRERGANC
ncbi:MAG: hypothetical protein ABSG53_00545 [Thermoguttaceae bacterium]|jgi:hypothetical protein